MCARGAEKNKRVAKRATVMQARKPNVDLAALESEGRRIMVVGLLGKDRDGIAAKGVYSGKKKA